MLDFTWLMAVEMAVSPGVPSDCCGTETLPKNSALVLEPKGGSAAAAVMGKQMLILMKKPA